MAFIASGKPQWPHEQDLLAMKLLMCLLCNDVISLRTRKRSCHCKSSSGKYLQDKLTAEFQGRALLLGIANDSFGDALNAQINHGDKGLLPMGYGPYVNELKGRDFTAFVIPESARTAVRIGTLPTRAEMIAMKQKLPPSKI